MTQTQRVISKIFFAYRVLISPALHFLGGGSSGCRFHPTCSDYCQEAIEKKGIFLGILLGFLRVLRCNPLSKGGFDPVKGV